MLHPLSRCFDFSSPTLLGWGVRRRHKNHPKKICNNYGRRGSKYSGPRKAGFNVRVGIATDHAGFALKEELVAHLREAGHKVVDVGAYTLDHGDDYPDFVIPLAQAVATGNVERGVAVCGVGAAVCANKIRASERG
jgi:ribose 5-phosphate isomerase B